MLNYLSILIEAEEIHRYVLVASRPYLVRMNSYQSPSATDRINSIDLTGYSDAILSKYSMKGVGPSSTKGCAGCIWRPHTY